MSNSRILVIADDLTGGNSCGALFAEAGFRTLTTTGPATEGLADRLDEFDVVVVNAESRHVPPAEAALRYTRIAEAAGPVDVVASRIDTTLRGNVGASAKALLDSRRSVHVGPVVGLCIPAFPSADRTTVGGRQLLHGRLLERTELAQDVRSPVSTSVVADVLSDTTHLSTYEIGISDVLAGGVVLESALLEAANSGADVIVCDALTLEQIDEIGMFASKIARESPAGLEWVAIDPGPGSLALSRHLVNPSDRGIILGVSGSVTEVTRAQLSAISEDPTVRVIRAPTDDRGIPITDACVEAILDAASSADVKTVVLGTVLDSSDFRELSPAEHAQIPVRLSEIVRVTLGRTTVDGLYTTGGDVTAAVLQRLGAHGMEIDTEIIPLAVGGRLAGGEFSGLPIVTKGGLIGSADTISVCVGHLLQASAIRKSDNF